MALQKFIRYILLLFFILFAFDGIAQFYNGHQMKFGKNRVQYNNFYWWYYRFDNYDIYHNDESKDLAIYTARYIEKILPELESFFEYALDKRIIFILYDKQSEFKQSNIGLVSNQDATNTGGDIQVNKNKVFLYFEKDHAALNKQINAAIAKIILDDMMQGNNIRDKATSNLLTLPDWYYKGLISFIAENWSIEIENRVKDGILNESYKKFNHLTDKDAVYAGHSIWRYIANTYGKSVIPNIIYMTRINKSTEAGFLFVLGHSTQMLSTNWYNYYYQKYSTQGAGRTKPAIDSQMIKTKKNAVVQEIKINPKENSIAYVENQNGQYKVWYYNADEDKKYLVIKNGYKHNEFSDYTFPLLTWHPAGEVLTVVYEYKGELLFGYYSINDKKFSMRSVNVQTTRKTLRKLFYFEKILSIEYAQNGRNYVFSALKEGQVDIFTFNISSNKYEQITNDLADDLYPRFINNDTEIIFSSNRVSDTLPKKRITIQNVNKTYDLFLYNYEKKSRILKRLTNTPYENEFDANALKNENLFVFLSDQNGIINQHTLTFDSTISHVDTTVHYRYFTQRRPVSNYSRNITDYHINTLTNTAADIIYYDKKYHIFEKKLQPNNPDLQDNFTNTDYRDERTEQMIIADSLEAEAIRKEKENKNLRPDTTKLPEEITIIHPDSTQIDIQNYWFEVEKRSLYYNTLPQEQRPQPLKTDAFQIPKLRSYQTTFYINDLVSQMDFSFLNYSYTAFSPGGYPNPGINLFSKLGVYDLFEDYKIIAGFRLPFISKDYEYFLSVENLKNRLDKQYIFHFQNFIDANISTGYTDSIRNFRTYEFLHILKYPFSEISAVRLTNSLRYDRNALLSTDNKTIKEPTQFKYWASVKGEYIFDNTKKIDLNIYEGTRLKAFTEYHQEAGYEWGNLVVFGADVRNYLKIHRNLIFASRFAASTAFGKNKLIYYLGGVDNWLNLSATTEKFNKGIPIDYNKNYVFQALATNVRGFSQNIRNGNSFVVVNTEIRWPVIKYLVNRPMNSDFFNNFQVVGFFDVGSAWSGLTPYSEKNSYDITEIKRGESVTILIDNQWNPWVAGYGFGFRSRLFGYFVRTDWAWGIDTGTILPQVFYLSLCLDF